MPTMKPVTMERNNSAVALGQEHKTSDNWVKNIETRKTGAGGNKRADTILKG